MPSPRYPQAAFRPISGGNAVTIAVQLYLAHLRQYLKISGIATLWVLSPFLIAGFLGIAGFAIAQRVSDFNMGLVLILIVLIPVWLFLLIWCMAKSLRNLGLICRLAYYELAGQPETPQHAAKQLRTCWWFLLMQFLVGLVLQAVSFVLQIGVLIIGGVLGLLSNTFSAGTSKEVLDLLLNLLTILGFITIYFWFYIKLFVPEVALSVEPKTDGVSALGRSWQLSNGSSMRAIAALSIATFLTAPLYILSLIPLVIGIGVGSTWFSGGNDNPALVAVLIGLLFLVLILFFLIINLFVLPFWQTLKAVLYYDFRVRKEGFGLQFPETP
jgi:hypothetical protein